MKEIATQSEFLEFLAKHDKVIVDFFATWCGPCVRIGPVVQKLSEAHATIAFVKVDVDKNGDTSTYAEIKAMPTFISYFKGKEMERIQGASEEKLNHMILNLQKA